MFTKINHKLVPKDLFILWSPYFISFCFLYPLKCQCPYPMPPAWPRPTQAPENTLSSKKNLPFYLPLTFPNPSLNYLLKTYLKMQSY